MTKVCTKCGKEKLLKKFYKNKRGKYGRRGSCKKCDIAKGEQYRKDHVEERKRYRKQYCKDNKDQLAAYNKQYRKDNKDQLAAQKKQYHKDQRTQWLEFMHADKLKCSVCGYSKCFAALDMHHLNPNDKEFIISNFLRKAFTKENQQLLLREIGKCTVLCCRCHREFHYNQRQLKQEDKV